MRTTGLDLRSDLGSSCHNLELGLSLSIRKLLGTSPHCGPHRLQLYTGCYILGFQEKTHFLIPIGGSYSGVHLRLLREACEDVSPLCCVLRSSYRSCKYSRFCDTLFPLTGKLCWELGHGTLCSDVKWKVGSGQGHLEAAADGA